MSLNKSLLIFLITITNSIPLHADGASINYDTNNTILSEIHSDEVRSIMRRLKSLNYDREHTDFEIQELSHKQIELLSGVAKTLIETANNIPNIDSLKNLTDEEQVIFNAMANRLYDITHTLKEKNKTNEHKAWAHNYLELQKTCKTCHRLFHNR